MVVDGLDIRVIDTPGLCDTSEESLQKMLISMAKVDIVDNRIQKHKWLFCNPINIFF